jgi:fructosamine-3-kinase
MAAASPPWPAIAAGISAATGKRFGAAAIRSEGGGSINRAFTVDGEGRRYFVKLNDAQRLVMFEAEADGLAGLAAAHSVRVPVPVCCGSDARHAWLVLEHLPLGGPRSALSRLGERLADLHRHSSGDGRFGWQRDNTIGATSQPNAWSSDWVAFLRDRRLGFQLSLACRHGFASELERRGGRLLACLDGFFTDYRPQPSLLHGDLWAGNAGVMPDGEPVIFDPAAYYGDREADVAMTELFGGFPPGFRDAYHASWPLDPGYAVRKRLYNLYHLLNHLNLFGGSYLSAAVDAIDGLLAEARG